MGKSQFVMEKNKFFMDKKQKKSGHPPFCALKSPKVLLVDDHSDLEDLVAMGGRCQQALCEFANWKISILNTQMLHVWNIYLQNWVIFGVHVVEYSSTMEHLG